MTELEQEEMKAAEEAAPAEETEAEKPEEAAEAVPEESAAAEENDPEASVQQDACEKKKGGFFGKSSKEAEKAKKALAEAEEKLQEMTDRTQRTMAEFDNFRKRTEKEKAAMYEVGARSVLEKLLPIADSFERGLGGLSEEQKAEPFAAGMDLVYKQLQKMFEELEVKVIPAEGETFNPDLHNAVMHVEDEEAGENQIVQEFMKGYTYRGTVIRYSMVKVAN